MPQTIQSNLYYATTNEPDLTGQLRSNGFPLSTFGELDNSSMNFAQIELSDNYLGMSSQLGCSTSTSTPPDQLLLPENDLLESMITELSCSAFAQDWWDDTTLPSDPNLNFSIPNLGDSKQFMTPEPSLEQLLGSLITDSENKPSVSHSKIQVSHTSDNSNSNNSNNSSSIMQGSSTEVVLEGTNGKFLSIDDSCSINNTKKPEEGSKMVKKRARPGESTRPRPKDRQQIQDRVKELREIVPNSAKVFLLKTF